MNKSIVTYAVIGALLMGLMASRGRKRSGNAIKGAVRGAALGAVVGWVAPRFGVRLPGTAPSQLAGLPGGPPC